MVERSRETYWIFSPLFCYSPISLTNTGIWILWCSFVWWFFFKDSSGNIWTMRIRFGRKSVFGVFHIKDTFARAIYFLFFSNRKRYICIYAFGKKDWYSLMQEQEIFWSLSSLYLGFRVMWLSTCHACTWKK